MSQRKLVSILCVCVLGCCASYAAAADAMRAYAGGNYSLTLDGVNCGTVKSVDGGAISADVVTEKVGPDHIIKKHLAGVKYEDITLQIGFSNSKAVYDWIAASWAMSNPRKDGSIITSDFNQTAMTERQFTKALITETTIPALDAGSKEPAYLTVKITPETIKNIKPTGKAAGAGGVAKTQQKVFLPANFRLEIEGLDCTKVVKIDALTVKQNVVTNAVGETRDYQKEPAAVQFPNLKITLPESAAKSFVDWHEDFVIKGNNDESKEKKGTLTLLTPNLAEPVCTINFFNMGIFRISPVGAESGADTIKRVTVELYVERMEFVPPKSTIGAANAAEPLAGR